MDILFRLDVIETGTEWVIDCNTPVGRSILQISSPFTAAQLETALQGIERSLLRSSAPVIMRSACAWSSSTPATRRWPAVTAASSPARRPS